MFGEFEPENHSQRRPVLSGAGCAKETAAYYDVTNIIDLQFRVNIYNKTFLRFFIFMRVYIYYLYYRTLLAH